jgi:hypothetical protein
VLAPRLGPCARWNGELDQRIRSRIQRIRWANSAGGVHAFFSWWRFETLVRPTNAGSDHP